MQLIDRIIKISENGGKYGRGEIISETDIHPDLWFFQCHFPGDPVMPGSLGLDTMRQMVGTFLTWTGNIGHSRVLGIGKVKFTGQVLPSAKKILYRVDIKRVDVKRINSRKLVVGIADGIGEVDGRRIYVAKELQVGLFTYTRNF